MVTLKALIFDFDGLIADTELPIYISWQELYRAHGHELAEDDWVRCVGAEYGPDTFDPFKTLEAFTGGPIDWEAVQTRRQAHEAALLAALSPLPGVEALIHEARAAGLKLGIGSSSPHEWVDAHLQHMGLWADFEVVVCADDVARVKPAPDLFLKAAERLNVQPAEAAVLEDSPHGLTAARAAGIFCVAVPNTLTRHQDTSHANLRVESMADLTLAGLQAAFAANGH
jgi:HAD superfamily hydrolase (TIGR01509 family)